LKCGLPSRAGTPIIGEKWEVGSQYGGPLLKGFLQCQSRHTTAAGIESVKEQYLLLLLHIGVQRYSKNHRKTPVDALFS